MQRGGGRSPALNGQLALLLVGMLVGLVAAVSRVPRRGWAGKLNFIAALSVGHLPLGGVGEISPAKLRRSISLLLEEIQQVVSGALNLVFS